MERHFSILVFLPYRSPLTELSCRLRKTPETLLKDTMKLSGRAHAQTHQGIITYMQLGISATLVQSNGQKIDI